MIAHNKGKRFVKCKECDKKRYCTRVPTPNHNFRYTCSKGHSWVIEGVTLERIVAAFDEIVLPSVKSLFDRDDTFYENMSKRSR